MTTSTAPSSFDAPGQQVDIYLSPHLDDAALSCGGTIHRQTSRGNRVLVITVFAGEPDAGAEPEPQAAQEMQASPTAGAGRFSSFALYQHRIWGTPRRAMTLRRTEDVAALTVLRAQATHLDYQDAVYRASPEARWLYIDSATLFGAVAPEDPVTPGDLARSLVDLLPPPDEVTLYAPLAIGRHVDHQIVHGAARHLQPLGYRVAYYEDYPYARVSGAVEMALDAAAARGWAEEVLALEPVDVAARVTAVGYYRSQMGSLFYGAEAMPNCIWSFAATRGTPCLAERRWWPNG